MYILSAREIKTLFFSCIINIIRDKKDNVMKEKRQQKDTRTLLKK